MVFFIDLNIVWLHGQCVIFLKYNFIKFPTRMRTEGVTF